MSVATKFARLVAIAKVLTSPRTLKRLLDLYYIEQEAVAFTEGPLFQEYVSHVDMIDVLPEDVSNPLWKYYSTNQDRLGIWKWVHYFDVYQTHLSKFVDKSPHLVEIGVYNGGSLSVWRSYFGEMCQITGVDIDESCKMFEQERIRVLIGDQADREFWKKVRSELRPIDILIDDGGHSVYQQRATLEETLPYLNPGGVYICEDIHGVGNNFASFLFSIAEKLNCDANASLNPKGVSGSRTRFQNTVLSVHIYPYMAVIERSSREAGPLSGIKHGKFRPDTRKEHVQATENT